MIPNNEKSNNGQSSQKDHANQNDQTHYSRLRKFRTKKCPFGFKPSSPQTGLSESSSFNQQKSLIKTYNSFNKQKQSKNEQNPLAKQSGYNTSKDEQQNRIMNKYNFGFERLKELCDKDPCEIIFVVSNKANGFINLFQQNKNSEWIFLLMKISAKICSTEFTQSKTILLVELTCNQFLEHLKTYISSTPTEKNVYQCNNLNAFFDDCLIVFQSITYLLPKTAVEKLKEVVVSSNIALTGLNKYCNNIKLSENLMVNMNELLKKINEIELSDDMKSKEKSVLNDVVQFLDPPENFRELNIYPTVFDLEFGEPFLRPNILKGAYQNIEHYLDVQFRLLREDFIAPLREGIGFYKDTIKDQKHHQRKKKINNIRIYQNVEFELTGEFVRNKSGYLINFNNKNKLRINWQMTKRFLYGSLLLFTVNDFQTFFLGVVLERQIELLNRGKLYVELIDDIKPLKNTPFTMAESEIFFEPYKCSMEVLKNISSHNFPMEKYIISACNKINHPYYIDLIPDKCYSIDDLNKFQVLLHDQWPAKEQLGLDEMQYKAFKAALTQEFTIIQGPPGSGKTFIGLKIMKTIVNNLYKRPKFIKIGHFLKPVLTKPVIVVCYTNHALDQFMEGIINFTHNVVRIGGQSKSEIINEYNLKNIIPNRKFNSGLQNVGNRLHNTIKGITDLRKLREDISCNSGVLELSLLKNGMSKRYHSFFNATLDLLTWLFQDFDYFSEDPVVFISNLNYGWINKTCTSEKLLELNHEIEYCDYTNIYVYSITLGDIKFACDTLHEANIELENLSNVDVNFYNKFEEVKFNFDIMNKIHDYFTDMLSLADVSIKSPKIKIDDLNMLSMEQRWSLYFHWVKTTKEMFDIKIMYCEKIYSDLFKQHKELKQLESINILSETHVVALTTTGAAKHRIMLEGLESPIVVVEEAAEVLEAHIVSSLTKHCQHLIMIGDHKQLRPSNAVYKLAKDYNFDVSLFERMVNNGVPCYSLGVQHRMRPEIASLITPSIYPQLQNHTSVYNREEIRGITKNMFFLNHNIYEKEVEEISSKTNEHEATFLIMFARHLILQGYNTDQVTILTTYSGQLFYLRSVSSPSVGHVRILICELQKKHSILENMKIKVVDNYQGEECDIILLSLVRSNENGNVGFLKTENRICVALSRAKYGLYIIGNMSNLYNSGNLWKQIKETLVNQDSYGDQLPLECVIHSGTITMVSKSDDFNKISDGGCTMMCPSLLSCGHYCPSKCHPLDRDHVNMKCGEPCNKLCINNHACMKKCFIECGECTVPMLKELSCGHQLMLQCFSDPEEIQCEEKVQVVLKECGHTVIAKCCDKNPKCTFKCFDLLNCGHDCKKNCHKNDDPDHKLYKCLEQCERTNVTCILNHKCLKKCHEDCSKCAVKVDKVLPCGHMKKNVPCGFNNTLCNFPCNQLLKCNHKCQAKCHEQCKACEIQVVKVIPDCGHSVTTKCKIIPTRKDCKAICDRTLICGHKCKSLCAKICTTKNCKEIVLQKINVLACGHDKVWVLCCDRNKEFKMDSEYLLDKCREPCLHKLHCGDICQGTCGQCKQGRLHEPCREICKKINPCNHVCKSPCKELCPPCNQKCQYSCVHSECTRNCGDPCISCERTCTWKCRHLTCTEKCADICNREPCYKPCDSMLKCGHECIGFCGEPCPPLCRICQKNEVMTVVFGNEDKPDARFVYLEDCHHSIESRALEKWMNQKTEKLILKQCPLCKTPIFKTQRFMNHVKVIMKELQQIKQEHIRKLCTIKFNEQKIIYSLKELDDKFHLILDENKKQNNNIKYLWFNFCKPLLASPKKPDKKHTNILLSANDIQSLDFVIALFKSVLSIFKEQIKDITDYQMKETTCNHFIWLLSIAFTHARKLSDQQKFDINMEMKRGEMILNFYKTISNLEYLFKIKVYAKKPHVIKVNELVKTIEAMLMSCNIYSLDKDEDIKQFIKLINKIINNIVITEDQKKQINAIHLRSQYNGRETKRNRVNKNTIRSFTINRTEN